MTTPASTLPRPFEWGGRDGLVWIEVELQDATAVFSTRLGGVSRDAYAELNLGILTDDDPALVQRNRDLLAAAIGRDADGFAMGRQVHGSDVNILDKRPEPSAYTTRGTDLPEADAQLTTSEDVTPLVLVADCVPLALSAPEVAGVVHCGWRGVAAGIVIGAVESICDLADASPADVTAALGPGIGPCCYEVGEEVATDFRDRGLDEALNGDRLDLALAIRFELERAGVDERGVAGAGICTSCHRDLFFSHRRDGGVTGRQAGMAWLSP